MKVIDIYIPPDPIPLMRWLWKNYKIFMSEEVSFKRVFFGVLAGLLLVFGFFGLAFIYYAIPDMKAKGFL